MRLSEEEEEASRRERCLAPEKRGSNYQNERLYTARILSSAVSMVTGSGPLPPPPRSLQHNITGGKDFHRRRKEGQRRSTVDFLMVPSHLHQCGRNTSNTAQIITV